MKNIEAVQEFLRCHLHLRRQHSLHFDIAQLQPSMYGQGDYGDDGNYGEDGDVDSAGIIDGCDGDQGDDDGASGSSGDVVSSNALV